MQKSSQYQTKQPTPWYGGGELSGGKGTGELPPLPDKSNDMAAPQQQNSQSPAPLPDMPETGGDNSSNLKAQVFGDGVDDGLQEQVTQLAGVVTSLAKALFPSVQLTDEDSMKVAKETLKTLAGKIADMAVEPMVDKIDKYLDKGKDEEKKPEAEQQSSKNVPPWMQ